MGRDSDEIFLGEGGAHRLAAVGAAQAIHFLPNFFVNLFGHRIQLSGWVLTQFGQEHPEAALVQVNQFAKGTKVDGLHSAE